MLPRRALLLGAFLFDRSKLLRADGQDSPILAPDDGFVQPAPFQNLAGVITPAREFFVRNHFDTPEIDVQRWKLSVIGEVEQPVTLTYKELLNLPAKTEIVTLECTGNPSGGGLVSTGEWRGPQLRRILEMAGIRPGAREVVLEGADSGPVDEVHKTISFARAIPLGKALEPVSLLAHTLNGHALPSSLGSPLRAVIPGWYAANSVKWLTRITVRKEPYTGFFQTQRYVFVRKEGEVSVVAPAQRIRLKAQISRPVPNSLLLRHSYVIKGAAWSDGTQIEGVEVSLNGGSSWEPAELAPPLAQYAWRLWELPWPDPQPGEYLIACRAKDAEKHYQPAERDPLEQTEYGMNAVTWLKVTVH